MKNTSSIDFATLNIIYKKYKYHLIYISVIIVCFIVLIFFTLPEFSQISQMGKERKIEEEKLKVLKNNLGILQGTDNTLLESQLQAVTTALPESKDYEGMIISFLVAYKFYIILGIIILIVLILILSYWKEIVDFFEEEDEVGYKRKRK